MESSSFASMVLGRTNGRGQAANNENDVAPSELLESLHSLQQQLQLLEGQYGGDLEDDGQQGESGRPMLQQEHGQYSSQQIMERQQPQEMEVEDEETQEQMDQLKERLHNLLNLRDYLVAGAREDIIQNAMMNVDDKELGNHEEGLSQRTPDLYGYYSAMQGIKFEDGKEEDFNSPAWQDQEDDDGEEQGEGENIAQMEEDFEYLRQLKEQIMRDHEVNEHHITGSGTRPNSYNSRNEGEEEMSSEDVESLTQTLNAKWNQLKQLRQQLENMEEEKQSMGLGNSQWGDASAVAENSGEASAVIEQQSQQLEGLLKTLDQFRQQKTDLEGLMQQVDHLPNEQGVSTQGASQRSPQIPVNSNENVLSDKPVSQKEDEKNDAKVQLESSMQQLQSLLAERTRLQQQLQELREEATQKRNTFIVDEEDQGESTEEAEYSDDFESISSAEQHKFSQPKQNSTHQISSDSRLSFIMEHLRSQFTTQQPEQGQPGSDLADESEEGTYEQSAQHFERFGNALESANDASIRYDVSPLTKEFDQSADLSFSISPDGEQVMDRNSDDGSRCSNSSDFEINLSPHQNLTRQFNNAAFVPAQNRGRPPLMPRGNPTEWLKKEPEQVDEKSSYASSESSYSNISNDGDIRNRILCLVEGVLRKTNTKGDGEPVVGGLLLEMLRDLKKLPHHLLQQPEFAKSVAMQTKSAIRHTASQLRRKASSDKQTGKAKSSTITSTEEDSVSTVSLSSHPSSGRARSRPGVTRVSMKKSKRPAHRAASVETASASDTSAEDHHARVYPISKAQMSQHADSVGLASTSNLNKRSDASLDVQLHSTETGREYQSEPFDYAESVETSHTPPSSANVSVSSYGIPEYEFDKHMMLKWNDNVWDDGDDDTSLGQQSGETSSVDSNIITDNNTSGYTGYRRASCNYAESVKSHGDSEAPSDDLESKHDHPDSEASDNSPDVQATFKEIQGYLNRLRGLWERPVTSPSSNNKNKATNRVSETASDDASWSLTSDWRSNSAQIGSDCEEKPKVDIQKHKVEDSRKKPYVPSGLKEGDVSRWEAASDSDDRVSIENAVHRGFNRKEGRGQVSPQKKRQKRNNDASFLDTVSRKEPSKTKNTGAGT